MHVSRQQAVACTQVAQFIVMHALLAICMLAGAASAVANPALRGFDFDSSPRFTGGVVPTPWEPRWRDISWEARAPAELPLGRPLVSRDVSFDEVAPQPFSMAADSWGHCGACELAVAQVIRPPPFITPISIDQMCNPILQPVASKILAGVHPFLPMVLKAECSICGRLSAGSCSVRAMATRACGRLGKCT